MEKYRELIEFAERIKAKGVPEQQYIAEGILELMQNAKCKMQNEDLAGSIVEEANGDRWIVEGWVYEAKELQDDFDRELRLRGARRTFTQDELDRGFFRVIAKAVV